MSTYCHVGMVFFGLPTLMCYVITTCLITDAKRHNRTRTPEFASLPAKPLPQLHASVSSILIPCFYCTTHTQGCTAKMYVQQPPKGRL